MIRFSRSWTGGGYTDDGAQARGWGDCSVVSTKREGPAGKAESHKHYRVVAWWSISNLERIRAL